MRISWYLPAMTPAAYRALSRADRDEVNAALDDWLDRLNTSSTVPADGSMTGMPPNRETRELG